jgi:hypothetical protein
MKTNAFFRLAALIVMTAMYVGLVNAQITHPTSLTLTTAQTVNINSSYHYGVDSIERSGVSNIYTWTITGVPAPVAGTHYVMAPVAATNNAQKRIQWLIAGSYVVHLTEANPVANGSCSVTHNTIAVTVSATPTGTVEFALATGTNQCPAAVGYSLTLTKTGTISYPMLIDVTYTINGSTSTAQISVANAGATLDIPAGVAFLNNTTTTDDLTRRVLITAAHDTYGGVITVNPVNTHTLTIWSLPQTTPITHD